MHLVAMGFLRGLYAPNCRCPSRWLGVFLWLAEFSPAAGLGTRIGVFKSTGVKLQTTTAPPPPLESLLEHSGNSPPVSLSDASAKAMITRKRGNGSAALLSRWLRRRERKWVAHLHAREGCRRHVQHDRLALGRMDLHTIYCRIDRAHRRLHDTLGIPTLDIC